MFVTTNEKQSCCQISPQTFPEGGRVMPEQCGFSSFVVQDSLLDNFPITTSFMAGKMSHPLHHFLPITFQLSLQMLSGQCGCRRHLLDSSSVVSGEELFCSPSSSPCLNIFKKWIILLCCIFRRNPNVPTEPLNHGNTCAGLMCCFNAALKNTCLFYPKGFNAIALQPDYLFYAYGTI